MHVLMLGWEFPPHYSGGLGVVCYELTQALQNHDITTTYVMPFGPDTADGDHVNLIIAEHQTNVHVETIQSPLTPYDTETQYKKRITNTPDTRSKDTIYGSTLYEEVQRFADAATDIAQDTQFDLIHAHDWPTYPAAMQIKNATNKPLITHVHATEHDRTGGHDGNPTVTDIEETGMHAADAVITVSNKVKQHCITNYNVDEHKINVVYNAVNADPVPDQDYAIKEHDKVVLSLGRITLQKGPEYFIRAAKRVIEEDPNVKFIMAGSGDKRNDMIHLAAELGIADKVLFPGFVPRDTADKLYDMADVFVMPSVSEPFGIVPLEAMAQDTPVIISKQSGVSEVLNNCIKLDFWDTRAMAEHILALLNYDRLTTTMQQHGRVELDTFDWNDTARDVRTTYDEVTP